MNLSSRAPGALTGTGGRDPVLDTEMAARRALIETCLRTGALGLNPGRAGNVSLRWHRGGPRGEGMLITPAAIPYEAMTEDDIVWMAFDADEADQGAHEGHAGHAATPTRRPSSEWRMHRDAYLARADAGAVVHTHSPAATALACLPKVQTEGVPAFHYMLAVAGGADIRCAPYRTFGTAELSEVAIATLHERRACLLANHGTIALGNTLADALELAAEVESLSRMYAQVLQLGEPVLLADDEIARVLARFGHYRRTGAPDVGSER